ncbi:hypothetical protein [Rossellomorea aquimaris]|uniref:hypothetical protein n=1 Tax=Rossellomorea aquimaris TaxID=189382 RepID=UPI0011E92CDF|nr:hypothetical protein [Rossellomorea aquimaris]TYS91937.1 hypothetical protein FZC88_07320 [Rossellomorea aquimaris]
MELKQYFTHNISSAKREEVEKSLQAKLDDGRELVKDITNLNSAGRLYDPHGRKFDGYVMAKYQCTVRKEKSKVLMGRNG